MNNDIYCKWCMEKNTAPQITPRDENRFSVSPAFNRLLIKKGSLDLNMQQDHRRRVDAIGEYR